MGWVNDGEFCGGQGGFVDEGPCCQWTGLVLEEAEVEGAGREVAGYHRVEEGGG